MGIGRHAGNSTSALPSLDKRQHAAENSRP
ncbi:hypothetical protein PSEUDO9AZ_12014 [Pseudomonas sp. 9AZ]|nr:hypothetical protein PSEUDO9AZ_12014 [Pseudomonas sp. 9AZ]